MADYKVLYRSVFGEQPDLTGMYWEPGCPLFVEALQVSRNTETAQTYLQIRVANISDVEVCSYSGSAVITTPDGAVYELPLGDLDADIPPNGSKNLLPIELPQPELQYIHVVLQQVKTSEAVWESTTGPMPLPVGEPLQLSDIAAAERDKELQEQNVAHIEQLTRKVNDKGEWWVCSCGEPNVGTANCYYCHAGESNLLQLEDEQYLTAAAEQRGEALRVATEQEELRRQEQKRKTKKAALIGGPIAAAICVALILVFGVFIPMSHDAEIQNTQARIEAGEVCFALSGLTEYQDDGDVKTETRTYQDGQLYSITEDADEVTTYTCDDEGVPIASTGEHNFTGEVAEANSEGLPKDVRINSGSGLPYHAKFTYFDNGVVKKYTYGKASNYGYNRSMEFDEQGYLVAGNSYKYTYRYDDDGVVVGYQKKSTETKLKAAEEYTVEHDEYGNVIGIYDERGKPKYQYSYELVENPKLWLQTASKTKWIGTDQFYYG